PRAGRRCSAPSASTAWAAATKSRSRHATALSCRRDERNSMPKSREQVKRNNRAHRAKAKRERALIISGQPWCGICRSTTNLVPDHDHVGIRGVLCTHCNLAIGHLRDDPILCEAAAAYLRAPPRPPGRVAYLLRRLKQGDKAHRRARARMGGWQKPEPEVETPA